MVDDVRRSTPTPRKLARHAEAALDGHVHFMGDRDDVPSVLAANDVAILLVPASRGEWGLSPSSKRCTHGLCCMASDLPGVSGNCSGAPVAGTSCVGRRGTVLAVLRHLMQDEHHGAGCWADGARARSRTHSPRDAMAAASARPLRRC